MLLVLLGVAQRRQRVRSLARLRYENREATGFQRGLAVAEFGRNIDLDRQTRKPLEPIFGDQSGVIGGAASRYRHPLERVEVERQIGRQPHALGGHVEVMRERVADDLRLLVNFLGHEVAVIALIHEEGRGR
jgi:hypothetical protein